MDVCPFLGSAAQKKRHPRGLLTAAARFIRTSSSELFHHLFVFKSSSFVPALLHQQLDSGRSDLGLVTTQFYNLTKKDLKVAEVTFLS